MVDCFTNDIGNLLLIVLDFFKCAYYLSTTAPIRVQPIKPLLNVVDRTRNLKQFHMTKRTNNKNLIEELIFFLERFF